MRHCSRLAAAGLFFLLAGPAFAADGALGPSSHGSIAIRVSVAPRAWRAAADTLCVAAIPGSFTLRSAPTGAPLPLLNGNADCRARAQAVALTAVGRSGLVLVVPD